MSLVRSVASRHLLNGTYVCPHGCMGILQTPVGLIYKAIKLFILVSRGVSQTFTKPHMPSVPSEALAVPLAGDKQFIPFCSKF